MRVLVLAPDIKIAMRKLSAGFYALNNNVTSLSDNGGKHSFSVQVYGEDKTDVKNSHIPFLFKAGLKEQDNLPTWAEDWGAYSGSSSDTDHTKPDQSKLGDDKLDQPMLGFKPISIEENEHVFGLLKTQVLWNNPPMHAFSLVNRMRNLGAGLLNRNSKPSQHSYNSVEFILLKVPVTIDMESYINTTPEDFDKFLQKHEEQEGSANEARSKGEEPTDNAEDPPPEIKQPIETEVFDFKQLFVSIAASCDSILAYVYDDAPDNPIGELDINYMDNLSRALLVVSAVRRKQRSSNTHLPLSLGIMRACARYRYTTILRDVEDMTQIKSARLMMPGGLSGPDEHELPDDAMEAAGSASNTHSLHLEKGIQENQRLLNLIAACQREGMRTVVSVAGINGFVRGFQCANYVDQTVIYRDETTNYSTDALLPFMYRMGVFRDKKSIEDRDLHMDEGKVLEGLHYIKDHWIPFFTGDCIALSVFGSALINSDGIWDTSEQIIHNTSAEELTRRKQNM